MAAARDYTAIVVAYAPCLAAGAAVLMFAGLPQPWDLFAADVVATLVIFGFSRAYRNSSFYDACWSVLPPLFALYWYDGNLDTGADPVRAWLVIALVWLRGIRLAANWSVHWGGLHHEDWRYPLVRARAGRAALWADLFGIHLFRRSRCSSPACRSTR